MILTTSPNNDSKVTLQDEFDTNFISELLTQALRFELDSSEEFSPFRELALPVAL